MEVQKKKIGILTCHRVHNFGALLQAYALKAYISSLGGYQVGFVDYWPDYRRGMFAIWSWNKFWRGGIKVKCAMLARILLTNIRLKACRKSFLKFIEEEICSSAMKTEGICYDAVIYGSDQIWKYQSLPLYKGYDKIYFGDPMIVAKRRIVYAASMGEIRPGVETKLFLKQNLVNFDAISVRESDVQEYVQTLTSLKVYHVVDPVFLLNKIQWDGLTVPRQEKKDYILLYNLQNRSITRKLAKKLSKDRNLPVIELNGNVYLFDNENKRNTIGPKEFLSYVKYATCVVTSSFHGTAFSIIYQKEFYSCLMRQANRVRSLLAMVGLEDRFISNVESYSLCKEIDYCTVEKKLQSHRESSIDYIKSGMTWN